MELSVLDGPKIREYLEKYKGQPIPRGDVRNPTVLKELGVTVRNEKDPRSKILEVFLLRTSLYKMSSGHLIPYLIRDNWSDYAKAWRVRLGQFEIHLPFRGKVAFLCNISGVRRWVCHPESAAQVEKVFVNSGELTFSHDLGRFKKETLDLVLTEFRKPILTEEDLKKIEEQIRNKIGRRQDPCSSLDSFVGLGLAHRMNGGYQIENDSLLLNELRTVGGDTDVEKVAKLILRKDSQHYMYIVNILTWLESLEREQEPMKAVMGSGTRDEDKFGRISDSCSINPTVVRYVIDYSGLGMFLEWYPRDTLDSRTLRWTKEFYCFLSCCIDSLGILSSKLMGDVDTLKPFIQNKFKLLKIERHASYLLRFADKDEILADASVRNWSRLRQKLAMSEIIDFNPSESELSSISTFTDIGPPCPSNVFIISKVPVNLDEFKQKVLQTLTDELSLRDSEGTFYYPDFRFLMCSRLGLSFNAFDRILAYALSKDLSFRARLWFPVYYGVKVRKHKIDEGLLSVLQEPFDTISLMY